MKYICAVYKNIILEIFELNEGTVWYSVQGEKKRYGFKGHPVASIYKNKDVSDLVKWYGNPVCYFKKQK